MLASPVKCVHSVTKKSLFLHIMGTLWYCYGLYYDRMYRFIPSFQRFGGRFQFLTIICAHIVLVSSLYAFIVDFLQITFKLFDSSHESKSEGYPVNKSIMISIRDELMTCWVFNLCVFVSAIYWTIIVIDKEGIHPATHEDLMPLFGWFNQFLHTIPLIYAIMLITNINYEYPPIKRVFSLTFIFMVIYLLWLAYCAKINGQWAYTFMMKQSNIQFALFICVCTGVLVFINLLGRKLSAMIWNEKKRDHVILKLRTKME